MSHAHEKLLVVESGDAPARSVLVRGTIAWVWVFFCWLLDLFVDQDGVRLRARWFRFSRGMEKGFVKGICVALAGSDYLELDDLPSRLLGGYSDILVPSMKAGETMRAWQSRYARLVYERCNNNKRQACRELGISYHTLRAHLAFRPERAQR